MNESEGVGVGAGAEPVAEERAVSASGAAVEAILGVGAEPYCDSAGMPRLRLPTGTGEPEGRAPVRIGSGEMRAWVAELLYRTTGVVLSGREFADVGWILRGIAEKKRQPLECADAVERDPVLATVIAFIEDQREGGYSGTATELLKDLLYECERFGFLRRDDRRWPKSGGRLGYRLEVWKPSLEEAGVVHEFHRFSYQRVHTLFSKKFRRG